MTAVALTDAALEQIALDRTLEKAFGDGDNDTGNRSFAIAQDDRRGTQDDRRGCRDVFATETAVRETLSVFKESGHRELTTQTSTFGKGFIHCYLRLSK